MTRILSIKLILLFTINIVSAQFISDHIDRTVPNNIHGQLNYSDMPLLSPDRFSFSQGFSMSMMSSGSKPTSIASYSNNVTYWASNNFKINANKKFENEINQYSFNWTSGGQFSKKKLTN